MACDLLIRNGQIFDLLKKSFQKGDIAVAGGKITRIGPSGEGEDCPEVLDASGCIVTPGLIDLYVHIFYLVHRISIHPARLVPRAGTTTMVDWDENVTVKSGERSGPVWPGTTRSGGGQC